MSRRWRSGRRAGSPGCSWRRSRCASREDVSGFVESFSGSHRDVLDFLAEEVLERQPEQVREFLLETSILERPDRPALRRPHRPRRRAGDAGAAGEGEPLRRRAGRRAPLVPLPSPLRRLPARPPHARKTREHGRVAPPGLRLVRGQRAPCRGYRARALRPRPRPRGAADRERRRRGRGARRGHHRAALAGGIAYRSQAPEAPAVRRARGGPGDHRPAGRR